MPLPLADGDGQPLSREAIDAFVAGVTSGAWPDYQASALLMAIVLKGMGAREMREIAFQIHRVLTHRDIDKVIDATRAELAELCAKFAPYPT